MRLRPWLSGCGQSMAVVGKAMGGRFTAGMDGPGCVASSATTTTTPTAAKATMAPRVNRSGAMSNGGRCPPDPAATTSAVVVDLPVPLPRVFDETGTALIPADDDDDDDDDGLSPASAWATAAFISGEGGSARAGGLDDDDGTGADAGFKLANASAMMGFSPVVDENERDDGGDSNAGGDAEFVGHSSTRSVGASNARSRAFSTSAAPKSVTVVGASKSSGSLVDTRPRRQSPRC